LPVAEPDLAAVAAAFGHHLHAAGVPVTPERSARFASAIALSEPRTLDELYWLGSATLITSREQQRIYERIFHQVFTGTFAAAEFARDERGGSPASASSQAPGGETDGAHVASSPRGTSAAPGSSQAQRDQSDVPSVLAAVSTEERLHERDFAELNDTDRALMAKLAEQLALVPPMRQARRLKADRRGREWDVRRTLRHAHRYGGEPVHRQFRATTPKPRRIVIIADVSGSMEPYSRMYLHLMRGAVRALQAEAFVFATHLTRLTSSLSSEQADASYRAAVKAVTDWSGGTRIGRSLKAFIDGFGRRGMARGAVVIIVSDGWEIDDPVIVGSAMEQLARLAHHVIWVNPRKAAENYQPLVGGMAAALPFVDTFVSGHSLRAMEEVVDAIHAVGTSRKPIARSARLRHAS